LTSDELAGRDVVEDKVNDFLKTYMPNHARDVPHDVNPDPELLSARDNPEDFIAAMLRGRSLSSGQEIKARGFFSGLFDIGVAALGKFIPRDVTPDQLLAARGDLGDFVEKMNTRELGFKWDMQVRGLLTGFEAMGLHKITSASAI